MSDKESHEFQILKLRPWAITQALACLLQPSRPLMVAESRGTGNGQGVQRLQGEMKAFSTVAESQMK